MTTDTRIINNEVQIIYDELVIMRKLLKWNCHVWCSL